MNDPEHTLQEAAAAPVHEPEQYDYGFGARFREEAFSLGATRSWQAGWADANRELGKFDEAFSPAQSSLPFFGTGEEARRRGLSFDSSCSSDWKRGWVEADIALGLDALSATDRA